MNFIEIIKPDDWHVHFREGKLLKPLVQETSKIFNRSIVMPNLIHPIQTEKSALSLKKHIKTRMFLQQNCTRQVQQQMHPKEWKTLKRYIIFSKKCLNCKCHY